MGNFPLFLTETLCALNPYLDNARFPLNSNFHCGFLMSVFCYFKVYNNGLGQEVANSLN